jgi:hypothetical protein
MKSKRTLGCLVPLGLLALVIGLWALWALLGVQHLHRYLSAGSAASAPPNPAAYISELGQVGDLFGGINALFAALAVFGVLCAGFLQLTALLEARAALTAERERQDRQQFEATFFHLVVLSKDLLQSLRLRPPLVEMRLGKNEESVHAAVGNILGDLDAANPSYSQAPDAFKTMDWAVDRARKQVFNDNRDQLGPLFRTLFELFNHVGQLELVDPKAMGRYASIAKAQLSDLHVILFALYDVAGPGRTYQATVEKFHLLEPFAQHAFLYPLFKSSYGNSAFGPDQGQGAKAP